MRDREKVSFGEMKSLAEALPGEPENPFYKAVGKPGMSFICEVKKASPSKGIIDPVFDYLQIAGEYEKAGADAVSCLTEPRYFLGSDDIFREIRAHIKTPMIRKDFTVDPYQLYQAKVMGADGVLLICSLLNTETIARYLEICEDLGLCALVETHDGAEIASAVSAGARMIGVNNRNLKDFSVDTENSLRLRERVPSDILFVSESGIRTPEDIRDLKSGGVDAVLIGEALMKAEDKKKMLTEMRKNGL
jgi:indole-3-glycerol phosphate synthase